MCEGVVQREKETEEVGVRRPLNVTEDQVEIACSREVRKALESKVCN